MSLAHMKGMAPITQHQYLYSLGRSGVVTEKEVLALWDEVSLLAIEPRPSYVLNKLISISTAPAFLFTFYLETV